MSTTSSLSPAIVLPNHASEFRLFLLNPLPFSFSIEFPPQMEQISLHDFGSSQDVLLSFVPEGIRGTPFFFFLRSPPFPETMRLLLVFALTQGLLWNLRSREPSPPPTSLFFPWGPLPPPNGSPPRWLFLFSWTIFGTERPLSRLLPPRLALSEERCSFSAFP